MEQKICREKKNVLVGTGHNGTFCCKQNVSEGPVPNRTWKPKSIIFLYNILK